MRCGGKMLRDKLTILVCSCDKYSDLWNPFFTLLHKYWNPIELTIILNTESKEYFFDGLDIQCVHSPKDWPYGKRMINALSNVKTKYVFTLLDDFFIRKPIDENRIFDIIRWMEADENIVCFTSDCTKTYMDWEVNKYPGFKRVPPGNPYTLNMQAAIWRTSVYRNFWLPDVSPWEWEEYTNFLSFRNPNHKFYCTIDWEYALCDYGYSSKGMGVYHGKWVIEDVAPLFEKEGILMDFSKRGIYAGERGRADIYEPRSRIELIRQIKRCLGWKELFKFFGFYIIKYVSGKHFAKGMNYFSYSLHKAKKRLLDI